MLSSNMSPVRLYWFCTSRMLRWPRKLCSSPTETVNSVSVQFNVLNSLLTNPRATAEAAALAATSLPDVPTTADGEGRGLAGAAAAAEPAVDAGCC